MKTPYLRKVTLRSDVTAREDYPLSLPIFKNPEFSLDFTTPITIITGENGSGKSTLLESIADHCGFNLTSGNRNHILEQKNDVSPLTQALRFSWALKVNQGFFMRAESVYNFAAYLDEMAKANGPIAYAPYGGESLNKKSHGEGFIGILQNRFSRKGIYILDEPESALSPMRQLSLLTLLNEAQSHGAAQIIIATHSPILMSFPHCRLLEIKNHQISETAYKDTEHFKLYARFMENPEKYHKIMLS
ncbi:MAG: AAA family ATPase [bacterium]|nr:AAA family ATPase [bacterium]